MPPIVQSVIVDIQTEFEKRVFQEAKLEIDKLDNSINKLKADALSIKDKGTPAFAALTREIGDLTRKRNELTTAMDKGRRSDIDAAQAQTRLKESSGLAGNAINGLKAALSVAAVVSFTKAALDAAAAIDKAARSFEAFGFSAGSARRAAEDIDALAVEVPFSGDELLATGNNLVKFGIGLKDVKGILSELAAISAGSGISLDELSDAFGRANATGRVFNRDFLNLYKNVPGLVESISRETGKTVQDVVKLGKSGQLSFSDFAKGIKEASSETGKYGQILETFQNSFDGTRKQVSELGGDFLEVFGKASQEGVSKLFKTIIENEAGIRRFAEVLGNVVSAVAELVSIFVNAGASLFNGIDKIGQAIDRFFGIGTASKEKLSKDIKETSDQIFGSIFDEVEEAIKGKTKSIYEGLTDEEIAAINERKAKIIAARKAAIQEELNAVNTANELAAKIRQKSLIDEGLEIFAERENIIKQAEDNIKKLDEGLKKAQIAAAKVGGTVAQSTVLAIANAKQLVADATREQLEEIDKQISDRISFTTFSPISALIPVEINFDTTKLTEDFRAKFIEFAKGVNALTLEENEKIKNQKQADSRAKFSFLGQLLGIDNEADLEKFGAIFKEQLGTFSSQAISAADTFISSELAKTDFLVSETEKRLNQLLSVQEGGNAEQIALEQKRLNALTEQRLKFQERQKAIDAAQILAANAVSAAESIKAITGAFGKSGGNPVVGIAASIALAATIAATIAALNSSFGQIPAFWEGAERVSDKLKPSRAGRDGYLTRVDGGERIVPTDLNKRIPSFVKNKDLPGLVELGLVASGGGMNDKNITRKQDETNKLLRQQSKLLRNQSIRLELVGDNSEKLRLQRMRK